MLKHRYSIREGLWLAIILSLPLCSRALNHPRAYRTYDVVIAGAGTGGFSAAIQAARLGAKVALLEETDWIGGQMAAAGVSTMDEAYTMTPPSGIYAEFLSRMKTYYLARGKPVGTCYQTDVSHCYEPGAIRKVLTNWIAEVNANPEKDKHGHIDLYLQDRITRVLSDGNTVTGEVTERGMTLHSKVLIDATEFGDVLPLTPAAYRSGSSIGVDRRNSCIQDVTYPLIMKKYPGGIPTGLRMADPPPGYEKLLPVLKKEMQVNGGPFHHRFPIDFAVHNEYRGLPDSSNPDPYVATENRQITKTGLNWFNDYPAHTDIFDREQRKKIVCEAKLKTLEVLYYIQHEMKEPWSVANDEGYDTAYNRKKNSCPNIPQKFKEIETNFPQSLYTRESQRLIGEYTLTGADLRRNVKGEKSAVGFRDAIAVGDYAEDLHGCSAVSDFDTTIEHQSNLPPGGIRGPFEVPLRSLIPEKVDGLLAAEKNISQSRLANGATRLQPITMLTGQAAGTLAALAVTEGVQPRAVSTERVQIALLRSGSILAREPMHDVPMETAPWQAAQFAVTHEWITMDDGGFAPGKVLTRTEAAEMLAYAFSLTQPTTLPYILPKYAAPTYEDLPLYAKGSAAVESLHAVGIDLSCKNSPARFCPNGSFTTEEFIKMVQSLDAQKSPHHPQNAGRLLKDVLGRLADPITRGDAATILYSNEVDGLETDR